MNYCKDCGTRMAGNICPNCHEETIIAQQYRDLGEVVPESIARAEEEQEYQRSLLSEHGDFHTLAGYFNDTGD
jgi:hypothetical protein